MSTFTSVACTTSGNFCWASGTGKIGSGSVGPIVIYCNTTTGSKCANGSTASAWLNDTVPSRAELDHGLTCPSTAVPCFALDTTSSSAAGVLGSAGRTCVGPRRCRPGIVAALRSSPARRPPRATRSATSSTAAIVVVLKVGHLVERHLLGRRPAAPRLHQRARLHGRHHLRWRRRPPRRPARSSTTPTLTVSFSGSATPSSLTGLYLDNPPIMVSNSNLQPNTTIEMAAPTTANGPQTAVGPALPVLRAAIRSPPATARSELTNAPRSRRRPTPGRHADLSPAAPTVILPMGLLPIQAINSSGVAHLGGDGHRSPTPRASSARADPARAAGPSRRCRTRPPTRPTRPATPCPRPAVGRPEPDRRDLRHLQVTVKLGATIGHDHRDRQPDLDRGRAATTYYMPTFVPIAGLMPGRPRLIADSPARSSRADAAGPRRGGRDPGRAHGRGHRRCSSSSR